VHVKKHLLSAVGWIYSPEATDNGRMGLSARVSSGAVHSLPDHQCLLPSGLKKQSWVLDWVLGVRSVREGSMGMGAEVGEREQGVDGPPLPLHLTPQGAWPVMGLVLSPLSKGQLSLSPQAGDW
jgi:hypothetical protein